ncbi:type I-F CRISPR-associated protein Csy2 [Halomonas alkaliantarctica]|uniref:Type I-F CRISPR-associated protein Csy2 n=1 Tax=Halomonas alkaliantarctica TaxID=232346 RepID=A0ABY8LQN9_9GAMM|nr:type I-F CRISPR-associated protein Csy2 [Halomonas alkaliantarctica]WGI25667.1 type I-F CRISPR-associated protein Csy2 [Halomonas alkaliantarctica]
MINHLLVLPRLRIQNANAISSPMTWGFPAMSAFVGVQQVLERNLPDDIKLVFNEIGVVCHHIEPQVTEGGFIKAFHLTRNPVDKSGGTAAIVEEGRSHLEVTLLIGVESEGDDLSSAERRRAIAQTLFDQVQGMRIAGGSVMPAFDTQQRNRPELISFSATESERVKQWRRLKRRLLPGFALVLRDDLLAEHTATLKAQDESATTLDAWLDLSRLNHECLVEQVEDEKDGKEKEVVQWNVRRPYRGWLVPIPVGYGAISDQYDPGEVANARDPSVPFRFVESLYSIGEWVSPHRFQKPDDLMWFVENDLGRGIYRLQNDYANTVTQD